MLDHSRNWGQYHKVRTHPDILVVDTSIWIDLSNTRLIDRFFELPYSFFVTDFVQSNEWIHIDWVTLKQKGLLFQELDPQEVVDLYQLHQDHHSTSLIDLAMFFVARKVQGILLTGDDRLRKFAVSEMEVHGFLWAMDEMVDKSILDPNLAISRLNQILELPNTCLPQNECAAYIKKWKNK